MLDLAIHEIIFPIAVFPYCLTLSIIAIFRYSKLEAKIEGFSFAFLAFSASLWVLSPFINHYFRAYGWISGMLLINSAVIYVSAVTKKSLLKLLIPIMVVSNLATIFMLIFFSAGEPLSQALLAAFTFPLLLLMNIILYIYYFKLKSSFHLLLGIMATIMIAGAFYQTTYKIWSLPSFPTGTLGVFGFVLCSGYQLIFRGYLNQFAWKDYAAELVQKKAILQEKNIILKRAHIDSVIVLSQTIEAKDPYTRGHCVRVRDYSLALAKEFNFNSKELFNLELGAILHDIGKIGIAGAILNKNGRLTDEEFAEIKKHSDIGAKIIGTVEFFKKMVPMVRYHHEAVDGRGYPDGLKGDKIPLCSRILAVSDTYDAMTSDRPYRKAMPVEKALSIIREVAGTQLDKKIVDIFISKRIYTISHDQDDKLNLEF